MKVLSSVCHFIDNMEFMPSVSDKCYDITITDPQYGIKESSANHASRNTPIRQANGALLKAPNPKYKKATWDNEPPSAQFFEHLTRITRNQIIFGGNYFVYIVGNPFKPPRRKEWPDFMKQYPTGWIIWDKVNGGNDFNDCELAWTSFNRPTYILPYMWNGMMQGISLDEPYTQQGNKALNEVRDHSTQKPTVLLRKLYQDYSLPGQKIFDPCLGSGTNRRAAHDMGLHFEGCENDRDIYELQERRWREYYLQSNKLF